jgi:hypothetical protein
MGRRIVLLLVAIVAAACSSDPYPLPKGPPHAFQSAPAALGEARQGVVLFLDPRPGDRVRLIGAEAVGVADGASVTFWFSPPIVQDDGSFLVGQELEELPGAEYHATFASAVPGDTVGIVAEMIASKPGRYVLTGVRLRYSLNGGPERVGEGIDVVFTICADDPKPADCPEEPSD